MGWLEGGGGFFFALEGRQEDGVWLLGFQLWAVQVREERGGGGGGGGGRGPCGGGQDEEDAVLDGELVGLLAEAIKGLKGIFLGRKRVKPLAGIYMGPQ